MGVPMKTYRIQLEVPEIKNSKKVIAGLFCQCRPEPDGFTIWVQYKFSKKTKKVLLKKNNPPV